MEKLSTLNCGELQEINGGNPFMKKAAEWFISAYAWEVMSNAKDEFMKGWNSVEDYDCK